MEKKVISAPNAPAALGPYSHANAANGFVFSSGQIGIDPATGKLPEGIEAQAEQALVNLENVLRAAGSDMTQVLKTTVFVTDMGQFATVNKIYAAHFNGNFPARSCVQVGALPGGALVEVEAIALLR